jgi:clan AA aspartic protease (TIGR02281 family)
VYDTTGEARRLVITADEWGCFYVEALANGEPFKFLIDSGSVWSVSFGRQDAQRLGFNPDRLCYDRQYGTANGTGRAADFRLRIAHRRFCPVQRRTF